MNIQVLTLPPQAFTSFSYLISGRTSKKFRSINNPKVEKTEIEFIATVSFCVWLEMGQNNCSYKLGNNPVWRMWSLCMLISWKNRITNQKNWCWNVKARGSLFSITEYFFLHFKQRTYPIFPFTITVLFYKWQKEIMRMTWHQPGQRMPLF